MASLTLNAEAREPSTKGTLRSFRKNGKIPAVVYGGGQAAHHIFVDAKEFRVGLASISESTIIDINVGGAKKLQAFVKARQRAAVTNEIIHIDFLEISKDRMLRAKVAVHLKGTPIGVRDGGVLESPLHEVEVECLPADLPEGFDLDISGLHANQSLHVKDLTFSNKVKIVTNHDSVIAAVKFAKADLKAATAAAATAAPAAAKDAKAAPAKEEKKDDKK